MKQELKRIEAALHQLATQHGQGFVGFVPQRDSLAQAMSHATGGNGDSDLSVSAPPPKTSTKTEVPIKISLPTFPVPKASNASEPTETLTKLVKPEVLVQSLSNSLSETKILALPKLKSPTFTTHRNAANPALTKNLLKEIETIVEGWQEELQQALRQIQDLYLEGPIVDGWLESYTHQEGEAPALRHADIGCLMDYVEKMRGSIPQESDSPPASPSETDQLQSSVSSAGYRLCGLNEDGQLWFRHCPAEQVPSVGLAIARYQKLRILLSRKQYLETRLSQLAETLVVVHGKLND